MAEAATATASKDDSGGVDKASWDALIKGFAARQTETEAMTNQLRESGKLKRAIAGRLITDRPPPPPEIPPPMMPAPPAQPQDTWNKFGGAASVIGILGGLLSKAPLTASLKAGSAAMQGYHQRDLETYQQNLAQWKAQSEYAERLADWQNKRYSQAFEEYKDNHNQLIGALTAIAAADKDEIAAKTLQTGDLRDFGQLLRFREDAAANYRDARIRMDELAERTRHDMALEQERRDKVTGAQTKARQVASDGSTLLTEIDRLRKEIKTAEDAGISTTGGLGRVQRGAEAIGLSEGDIATRVGADSAGLRLKVESFLRRSRPNRYAESQIAELVKGAGFLEPGKVTLAGLDSLEQLVKDEIASAGQEAGADVAPPTVGNTVIPFALPGGTPRPGGAADAASEEAKRRYDAIFGGGQ